MSYLLQRFDKWFISDIIKQTHHNKLTVTRVVKKFCHFYGIHYHGHNSPLLVLILCQINPVHNLSSNFLKSILILTSHLHLRLPQCPFPTITLHEFLFSLMRTICPAQLTLLDFITRIIIREQHKLCSAS